MSTANPYQAPAANLNFTQAEDYAEVKFFSTSGRLGRVRYLTYSIGYTLLFFLFMFVLGGVFGATGLMESQAAVLAFMTGLSYVVAIVMGLVLARRRAHDFDKSGWFGLLSLIPLVNLLFLFVPGTDGENRYGKKTPPNRAAALVVGLSVIAFIGILAAIAVPAYNDYIQRAAESGMVAPAE